MAKHKLFIGAVIPQLTMYKKELDSIKKILYKSPDGLSILDISSRLKINRNSVAKYLEIMEIMGNVDMRKIGPTKLYSLSKKLPMNALLDLNKQIVISFDSIGRITQANKKGQDFFGDDIIGKNISSFIPNIQDEIEIKKKIWSVKKITTDYEDGTKGTSVIMDDITKEIKIKEELMLLKSAVEASSSGVTIADAKQEDLPLIYINPAFEQITGYKSNEVLGKNCRFLQGKRTDQPELTIVRKAIKEGKNCRVVLKNFKKNGKMFLNELRLSPVIVKGKLTHFVGIQTDITDRIKHKSI